MFSLKTGIVLRCAGEVLCVLLISVHRILRCTVPISHVYTQFLKSIFKVIDLFSLEWQGRTHTWVSFFCSVDFIFPENSEGWQKTDIRRNYEIRLDIHILIFRCTGGLWSENGARIEGQRKNGGCSWMQDWDRAVQDGRIKSQR